MIIFKPLGDSLSVSHIFLWIIKTKQGLQWGERDRDRESKVQNTESLKRCRMNLVGMGFEL